MMMNNNGILNPRDPKMALLFGVNVSVIGVLSRLISFYDFLNCRPNLTNFCQFLPITCLHWKQLSNSLGKCVIQNWRGHFLPPICKDVSKTVYLLQYSTWGHHSLGFYDGQHFVEFTYGDWALFALDKRDTWTAISHMLWPTQGALGRKVVAWQPHESLLSHFTNCIDIVPFEAEATRVDTLYAELEHIFTQNQASQVYHPEDGLYFVHYPAPYALWHNCNHELVKWLTRLGGNVKGCIFYQPNFTRTLIARD